MFRTAPVARSTAVAGLAAAVALAGLLIGGCASVAPAAKAPKADLQAIDAAIAGARLKSDFDEDSYRKPREVLEFIGARPGMKVIDVVAGRGYFSELLSRTVGPSGEVIAYNRADVSRVAAVLDERFGNARLPNVRRLEVDRTALTLPSASLDAALLVMVYHDMYLNPPNAPVSAPAADPAPFVAKLFAALKPGGVAVVEDHIADAGGTPQEVAAKLHRIDPEVIKRDFTAAGFVFEAASDVVRNPADDHKLGIRDAVAHHTDRSLLRFRKP